MQLAHAIANVPGYLFTNRVHIFLMPVVLTAFWNVTLQLPLTFEYYVMIVCSTAGGYVYNIYTDFAEDRVNYERAYRFFHRDSPYIKGAIASCYIVAFWIALGAGVGFAVYTLLLRVLEALYSTPVSIGKRVFRVKQIPFLKNIYAASFWSFSLILTPYLYVHQTPGATAWLAALASFGLAYFVELSWDMRDMAGDRLAKVQTVPLLMGERFTVWLLRIEHILACALIVVCANVGVFAWIAAPVFALHLAVSLVFLEWYRRLADRRLASHLFIVYAGILIVSGIAAAELGR